MAVKDWWNALTSEWGWGDDDTAYEDESSFDEDPYGIGSLFDPAPNIFGDEDWAETYDFGDWGGSPTEEDPYGIGAGYGDAFD